MCCFNCPIDECRCSYCSLLDLHSNASTAAPSKLTPVGRASLSSKAPSKLTPVGRASLSTKAPSKLTPVGRASCSSQASQFYRGPRTTLVRSHSKVSSEVVPSCSPVCRLSCTVHPF